MLVLAVLLTGLTALFVFAPLLGWGGDAPAFDDLSAAAGREEDALRRRQEILASIKDLELEYEVGKLTKEDYEQIRERLSGDAIDIYRQMDRDAKA